MKKWVLIGILVIFLAVVAWNSFYVVEENEYGCVFRFSEIVDTASDPGQKERSYQNPFWVDSIRQRTKNNRAQRHTHIHD